ncbi:hypothetical protein HOB10_00585 [Candidatus Parcubacteria bacterium]|nr:hypothetical protein [Candidatus Parcubacteria bacterium]
MIALGILTAALLHFWWTYLTAVVLIAAGYWLSLHINIPVRQVFMLTWFGKPLYPVFAKGASNLQRRDTKGSGWIPKPEANSDDHNKVLAVGLKRLRWIPNWLGPLDFVPLAWAKPENKTETDWLECMAIPETDDNGDEEAVAAGPSFKLNFREAHRLSLDHVDIFWGLADDERNRIDEYIIGVINDWLADYMHTQTPDMILDADFLKEMTSTKIDNLRRLRNRTDAAKDTVLRLAHEERQVKLRDIQRDLNDLRGYVLESTGHELLEIGMLRRVPDEIYKAQLDEYASKRAEEKTALRDINVQTAKGQAFVARLTSITEVLNVSLAAMNKPLVTEGEVWDQIIEDQRSRRAASHYLGGAKLGGLLSKLIPKK